MQSPHNTVTATNACSSGRINEETMQSPHNTVSSAIEKDLTETVKALSAQASPYALDTVHIMQVSMLTHLLPFAIYLESARNPLRASDLLSVNALDQLIGRTSSAAGGSFLVVASPLQEKLQLLPGYRSTNSGRQEPVAEEMFAFVMMACRHLHALRAEESAPV